MEQRRYKLTTVGPAVITAILLLVFVAIYIISFQAGQANIQEALDDISLPVLTTTAKLLFNPLYTLNVSSMENILDPYVDGTSVVSAAVYNITGTQIVSIDRKWSPETTISLELAAQAIAQRDIAKREIDQYLVLVKPISAGVTQIGTVQLVFDKSPLEATLGRAQGTISLTLLFALIVTAVVFYLLFQAAVRPLNDLANAAQQVSQGKANIEIPQTGSEELYHLSTTLTELIESQQNAVQMLEQRVATRTEDLTTVARISTATATIRDPFQLVATAVHLTQRGFKLYHCHAFGYHPDTDILQIIACGYKEGDEHEGTHGTAAIPLSQEQSLVARAARTRKPVIVNDVRSDPGWLPNPLLPDTRAEMAVPMIVGEELIGVLDVQAEEIDAFTEEDASIQLTLAAQLATSLQNARAYEQAQNQAKAEALVNTISQKIRQSTTIEETLEIAARELSATLGAARVRVNLGITSSSENDENAQPAPKAPTGVSQ
jgi:GAF domain-containing protein